MKATYVKEFAQVQANNPVLIEGLPGLGLVGKIAIRYLIKQLKAQKFAYLYSPHFPYFVLVNKKEAFDFFEEHFFTGITRRDQTTSYCSRATANHKP